MQNKKVTVPGLDIILEVGKSYILMGGSAKFIGIWNDGYVFQWIDEINCTIQTANELKCCCLEA